MKVIKDVIAEFLESISPHVVGILKAMDNEKKIVEENRLKNKILSKKKSKRKKDSVK